jgi:hypothetical protein
VTLFRIRLGNSSHALISPFCYSVLLPSCVVSPRSAPLNEIREIRTGLCLAIHISRENGLCPHDPASLGTVLVLGWRSVVAPRLGAVLRDHVPFDILSLLCYGPRVGRCVHNPRKSRMSAGISGRRLPCGKDRYLVSATISAYKQSQPSPFETDSHKASDSLWVT